MQKWTILFLLMFLMSLVAFAVLILFGAPEAFLTGFVFFFFAGKKLTHKYYDIKRN